MLTNAAETEMLMRVRIEIDFIKESWMNDVK
jgi:hypothetical protein